MKGRIGLLSALLALALLAGLSDRAIIRDGDQGAMLAGSLRIAEGTSLFRPGFYAYDRSWLCYGLTGAFYRLAGIGVGSEIAVIAANTLTYLLFWFSWLWLAIRLSPRASARTAVWCFLAAPVSLLASIYWNATALSSAGVALGLLAFLRPGRGRTFVGACCFAAAVGMRIDVLLLAPLIAWLYASPSLARGRIRWSRIFANRGMATAAAMAAAALIGRWLAGGRPAVADPYFDPLVVMGYTVFAAGSITLLCAAVTAGWRGRTGHVWRGLFSLAGLLALLLPWLFYLPQLHSPRYLIRGGEAVLLLFASHRGRAWMDHALGKSHRLRLGLAVLAALPLAFGLQFPRPFLPRPTLTAPTLMPTGDGLMPMGAVTSFLLRLRRASAEPVDHNQALWQAIQAADFPRTNVWRVVSTPQIGLFDLHAALHGARLAPVGVAAAAEEPDVIAETRMMTRRDPKQPGFDQAAVLLDMPAVAISPCIRGVRLVRFGEGDHAWSRDLRFLRDRFDGVEFRILPEPDAPLPPGHSAVIFADYPFSVDLHRERAHRAETRESKPAEDGRYAVLIQPDAARLYPRVVMPPNGDNRIRRADSALPAWMTR